MAALRKGDAGRDAAARARRYRQGLASILAALAAEGGGTPEGIAASLTRRGVRKPRGGRVWTPPDVRRLLSRLATETESRPHLPRRYRASARSMPCAASSCC